MAKQLTLLPALLLGSALVASTVAVAEPVRTDANLVTAVDLSDSIMRHEEWLQFEGMAKALLNPDLLDAVAGGRYGRIGFALFTWSSEGAFEVIVDWTVIASRQDTVRVAMLLRQARPRDRFQFDRPGNDSDLSPPGSARRTDLSTAIDFAAQLSAAAPFAARRSVINVLGNGVDNAGVEPDQARDRAVGAGMVINGLAIGDKRGVGAYFRAHVQGGPGSFVIEVQQPENMADALLRKFLGDLLAAKDLGICVLPSC